MTFAQPNQTDARVIGFCAGTSIAGRPIEALRAGDHVDGVPLVRVSTCVFDATSIARQPSLAPVLIAAGAFGAGRPMVDVGLAPWQLLEMPRGLVPAAWLVDGDAVRRAEGGGARYVTLGFAGTGRAECAGLVGVFGRAPVSVRAAIAARPSGGAVALRSNVERITARRVEGWSVDDGRKGAIVAIEVWCDGVPIAWGMADRWRPDLAMAGLANGACAFAIDLPGEVGTITVRRAEDGAILGGGEVVLTDLEAPNLAAALAATVAGTADRRGLAGFLFGRIDEVMQR